MLRAFTAKGYRNLEADNLQFERLNILVGPNNSGKSTLIDAIGFFHGLLADPLGSSGASKQSAFINALESRGRGDLLDRAVKPPGDAHLSWTFSSPGATDLSYELRFRLGSSEDFPSGFYITSEQLRYAQAAPGKAQPFRFFDCHTRASGKGLFAVKDEESKPKGLTLKVDPQDTVFHQLKSLLRDPKFYAEVYPQFERAADFVQGYFEGFRVYVCSKLDPRTIAAGARKDLSIRDLDSEATQLVNVLRYLDQEHDLDDYTRRLRELIPDLQRVKIKDVSDERQQIVLEIGRGQQFKLKEMSDGTIKAMVLALLMSTPRRMSLLAIDEPELNIHPAWLKVIGQWLQTCQSAEQIIVSTHSPDLLDQLTTPVREGMAALFVCNWPQRGIRRVDPTRLDRFFAEGWELGDLYRVGEPQLGGWPW